MRGDFISTSDFYTHIHVPTYVSMSHTHTRENTHFVFMKMLGELTGSRACNKLLVALNF